MLTTQEIMKSQHNYLGAVASRAQLITSRMVLTVNIVGAKRWSRHP